MINEKITKGFLVFVIVFFVILIIAAMFFAFITREQLLDGMKIQVLSLPDFSKPEKELMRIAWPFSGKPIVE